MNPFFLGYEKTYPELTNALSTFTHNILAMGLLTSKLQNSLLSQLGVSPLQDGGFWPLHVQPRTLTILAHVLLLRQTNTDQDLTGSSRYVNSYRRSYGLKSMIRYPSSEFHLFVIIWLFVATILAFSQEILSQSIE